MRHMFGKLIGILLCKGSGITMVYIPITATPEGRERVLMGKEDIAGGKSKVYVKLRNFWGEIIEEYRYGKDGKSIFVNGKGERVESSWTDLEERQLRGERIIIETREEREEEERRRKEYNEWAKPFAHLSEEERIKERKKFLYHKNRADPAFLERQRVKGLERFTCECGQECRKDGKRKHLLSQTHLRFLQTISVDPSI